MLGFVSALSATLAIIVLITSIMLVNLLSFSMEKSKQNFQIKFSGVIDSESRANTGGEKGEKGEKSYNSDTSNDMENDVQQLMISKYVISPKDLPKERYNIAEIETGCSYGNNFSYDVASKLVALNYIILAKAYASSDIRLNLQKPTYDENGINDCWVNTKSRE
ncbi:hypothetical protein DI464_16600 [Salmonella enterica subsp. enterica serovar Urbana]|nr:hypothetical protein [Salmonella enterica]ECU6852372.1 hypothetical protein [Salmonella enterica subsp. enterica serovar Urbana]ECD8038398.1 hypothetical protein [Salmonella enterica]EDC0219319.1 hypothetical protein [Salmonella enterica]EEC1749018.1 hypothetical protein [Salmonella enterica subsp. enterica serovar Urbana]